MKKITLLKIMVCLLGIVVTGVLGFNILAYTQISREISAVEKDEQVVTQMQDVAKLILLQQQQLENGSNNAAKLALSARIDSSLVKLKAIRGEVSPTVDESISVLLKLASKTQKEKTDYKLSLAQQVVQ